MRARPAAVGQADLGRARPASGGDSAVYLQLAERGVALAQSLWWDRRLGWYDDHLSDGERFPLATIWDAAPLCEALDAVGLAAPSPA